MVFETEITENSYPNAEWLGYWDSREYLQDSDEDYAYKHFFMEREKHSVVVFIVNETSESFWHQSEGEVEWPCNSDKDYEDLKRIYLESCGPIIRPGEKNERFPTKSSE